jgi:hypothetical protein
MSREHEGGYFQVQGLHLLQQGKPVHVWKKEVSDHYSKFVGVELLKRLFC